MAEDIDTIMRTIYFAAEELVCLLIILAMVAASLAIGTMLISRFGDVGGFIWLAVTYAEFVGYYPVRDAVTTKLRRFLV